MGLELVAHLGHDADEVALRGRCEDGPVNVRPDGAPVGGLAVLLRLPFAVVFTAPAGILTRNIISPGEGCSASSHRPIIWGNYRNG